MTADTVLPASDDPAQPLEQLDRIGATLRRAFDDAAAEPLPQAFDDLLRQLI